MEIGTNSSSKNELLTKNNLEKVPVNLTKLTTIINIRWDDFPKLGATSDNSVRELSIKVDSTRLACAFIAFRMALRRQQSL